MNRPKELSLHIKRIINFPIFDQILRVIPEYYFVANFVRVLESKHSDTSSLDYTPLRQLCNSAMIYIPKIISESYRKTQRFMI